MNTNLLKYLLAANTILILVLSGCGTSEVVPTLTPTTANTATYTLEPTATGTPTATLTPTKTVKPTSTPDIAATQKYENLHMQIEKLAGEGVIPSVDGNYFALDDYSKEFAKIAYYTWDTYSVAKSANFLLQARVNIANETTENAFKSACGFVFEDDFSQHAVFFSLDGNVNYRTDGMDRGSNYVDSSLLQNPDGVVLTLILYNKALLFYVNDRKALSGPIVYGGPFNVGPAILSGTSEGFGTRCDFTETALWVIE